MDVTHEVTCTLRAEAHHPPVVMDEPAVFENHSQDTRYTSPLDTAPTVAATYGMGGNNQPFVVEDAISLENHPTDGRIRISDATTVQTLTSVMGTGGCNVPLVMNQNIPFCKGTRPHSASEGQTWKNTNVANTLNTFDQGESRCNELVVRAYGISSKDSNGMKSTNPHVGFYEADTVRTLDANGGNPTCNQGGTAVVECPAYSMTTGSFLQCSEDVAPTVLARDYKDPSTVCYGIGRDTFNQGKNAKFNPTFAEDLQPTLVAKGPGAIQRGYTVRRLTPTECARLQGFPDWWCADLAIAEPTEADIAFWTQVWDTHRSIVNPGTKPKTEKQIRKWLADPHSDAAEYKMWGNGVCLNNVVFVLSGIVYCTQKDGQ